MPIPTIFPVTFRFALLVVVTCGVCTATRDVLAQAKYSEVKVDAVASGEELSLQPDLWVMDVYFKPLRMIAVDVTDPKTGMKKPQYVWYIVYRAMNHKLASRAAANPPENDFDKPVLPPRFTPEFTLVTTDGDEPKVYHDQVIPEAVAAILKRERSSAYKDAVHVVGDIPPATDAKDPEAKYIYGVATFTGLDPNADRYTVYMTGFSNGVKKISTPDGATAVQNKTIETRYWRPGDKFDLQEPEIRLNDAPKWIYR